MVVPTNSIQEMYDDFQKWKHRLDKEVEVLNLLVALLGNQMASFSLSSAQAAKIYFDNQTYTEVNLNGRKAHHSAFTH